MSDPLEPIVVVHGGASEWYAGTDVGRAACQRAAHAGWEALARGGTALDAVIAAVRVVEDDPVCNAGTGAVLTSRGTLELDACVMDGASLASGAVAVLPPFRHPIDIARAVLEDGRYHLLVGDGAAAFARARGFEPCDPELMITPDRRAEFEGRGRFDRGNTVGAVARDATGRLAAATSTGGMTGTGRAEAAGRRTVTAARCRTSSIASRPSTPSAHSCQSPAMTPPSPPTAGDPRCCQRC